MKHAKYLLSIIFSLIIIVACSSDSESKDIIQPTLEIDQNETIHYVGTEASSFSITVKSNTKFTTTSSATDWCRTETDSKKETGNLIISVTNNPNPNIRSAEITVKTDGLSPITIKVNQFGTSPTILIDEKNIELTDENLEFSLNILTNIEIEPQTPDWITASLISDRGLSGIYKFTASGLPDSDIERTGEVTITSTNPKIEIAPVVIPVLQKRTTYPRFAVISDTHFGLFSDSKERVSRALKNMTSKSPQLDAIFVVGDLTNSSRLSEYDELIQVFKENVPKTTSVFYMLGNHDHAWHDGNPVSIFMNKLKQPINQYIKIKGFPFITISLRGAYDNYFYTQSEIDFLSDSLEDASQKYPGRPIFVFTHAGVLNTVYGTGSSEGWGVNDLSSILHKYPQVILFSGHSHFPVSDPRSIHQGYFSSVNVGNTSYSEIEAGFTEGVHPPGNEMITEGIIATTKENLDVEMERWDTFRNEEILPRWIVKAPHNGTAFTYANRTGGSNPSFSSGDKPAISNITANACVVSFPQATDDEVVHHYIVQILNGNGEAYKTITIFSQFYLNSETPDPLDVNISGLESGTKYTIEITAVDSYNNKSGKISSAEFTTSN
ncbi:hypothetical protein D0T84_02880 [Dysgonomonas sp. 521]|uniref:metallophosphoesterase n=1 Tax=Dysgonomonas sp. 521 TaxID=2302932 RepID=UPI0013D86EF8|nr:metallophosphoesterase [Dysgonomonas sp. 521]NDV93863.1 hypothetical protein [Dysgonomonas sp. 521]